MPITTLTFRYGLCGLGALAVLASASAQGPYDTNWQYHVRAGLFLGFNVKADFSRNGVFSVPASPTAGVYDDGYVRVDATGNAQGYTSFWGYQSASQLVPQSHTLLMHQTTAYSGSSGGSEDDSPYFGGELAGGGNLWRVNKLRIGWEFGAAALPVNIKDSGDLPATVNQNILSFDTGNIVVPTAPYNGGPSGVGPTIYASPTAQSTVTTLGTVSGSQTLKATICALKLGPSFFWDVGQYVGIQAGCGPALGIVPGDLKYDETIFVPGGSSVHNTGSASSTEVCFGGYVEVIATVHVARNLDLYVGGQYLPLQDVTFSGGGREARLKLGGQLGLLAGLNWPF